MMVSKECTICSKYYVKLDKIPEQLFFMQILMVSMRSNKRSGALCVESHGWGRLIKNRESLNLLFAKLSGEKSSLKVNTLPSPVNFECIFGGVMLFVLFAWCNKHAEFAGF